MYPNFFFYFMWEGTKKVQEVRITTPVQPHQQR